MLSQTEQNLKKRKLQEDQQNQPQQQSDASKATAPKKPKKKKRKTKHVQQPTEDGKQEAKAEGDASVENAGSDMDLEEPVASEATGAEAMSFDTVVRQPEKTTISIRGGQTLIFNLIQVDENIKLEDIKPDEPTAESKSDDTKPGDSKMQDDDIDLEGLLSSAAPSADEASGSEESGSETEGDSESEDEEEEKEEEKEDEAPESLPAKPPAPEPLSTEPTAPKPAICKGYLHGNCRYGREGKGCQKLHEGETIQERAAKKREENRKKQEENRKKREKQNEKKSLYQLVSAPFPLLTFYCWNINSLTYSILNPQMRENDMQKENVIILGAINYLVEKGLLKHEDGSK